MICFQAPLVIPSLRRQHSFVGGKALKKTLVAQ
jgi:hypothetical protein